MGLSEHSASLTQFPPTCAEEGVGLPVETCCSARLLPGRQAVLVPETLSLMPRLLCGFFNGFLLLSVELCLGLPTWALKRLVSPSKLFSGATAGGCVHKKTSRKTKWLSHQGFLLWTGVLPLKLNNLQSSVHPPSKGWLDPQPAVTDGEILQVGSLWRPLGPWSLTPCLRPGVASRTPRVRVFFADS